MAILCVLEKGRHSKVVNLSKDCMCKLIALICSYSTMWNSHSRLATSFMGESSFWHWLNSICSLFSMIAFTYSSNSCNAQCCSQRKENAFKTSKIEHCDVFILWPWSPPYVDEKEPQLGRIPMSPVHFTIIQIWHVAVFSSAQVDKYSVHLIISLFLMTSLVQLHILGPHDAAVPTLGIGWKTSYVISYADTLWV